VHEILEKAKIKNFCKTSGASGLHICIPMGAKYTYDQAKDFMHAIAMLANQQLPKTTSLERSPANRQKKVYLDYLQNRRGQTLASVYSVRPRPGATVSTPLEWKEVKPGLDPTDWTIKNMQKRLDKVGDLWKPVLGPGINLQQSIRNLSKI
jgi:bifunctional non-homologous end joining protein LigD